MKNLSKKFPIIVSSVLSIILIFFLILNKNSSFNVSKISDKMYRSKNNGGIYITKKDGKNLKLLYKISYMNFKDTKEKLSGGEFESLEIKEKDGKRYLDAKPNLSYRLEIIDDETIYDNVLNVEYKYYKNDDFNKKDKDLNSIYLFFENKYAN